MQPLDLNITFSHFAVEPLDLNVTIAHSILEALNLNVTIMLPSIAPRSAWIPNPTRRATRKNALSKAGSKIRFLDAIDPISYVATAYQRTVNGDLLILIAA